jgi:hypothetical protein
MTHEEWTRIVVESLRHLWEGGEMDVFAKNIKVELKDTSNRNYLFTQIIARRRVDDNFDKGRIKSGRFEIERKKIDNAVFTILSELQSDHIVPFESREEEENFQRSVREFNNRNKH